MSSISEEAGAGRAEPAARRPILAWGVSGLAGLAGGIQGFLFGDQLGGPLLGVVAAINCAALCALLVSGLIDTLSRLMRRR